MSKNIVDGFGFRRPEGVEGERQEYERTGVDPGWWRWVVVVVVREAGLLSSSLQQGEANVMLDQAALHIS